MKRRRFVQTIMGAPAVTALAAQQPPPPQQPVTQQPGLAQPAPGIPLNPTQPVPPPASAVLELPKLDASIPDAAADMNPRFFTPAQFTTLRHVCDVLLPPLNGKPGALDAKAPEFLDFLISESPAARKDIYRGGLDAIQSQAKKRFGKDVAELDAQQIDQLLAPLRQPWTFEYPSDPAARLLVVLKQDVRTATTNSREYITANSGGTGARRGGAGGGLYWYPLD